MITLHTNYGDIVLELDFEKAPKTAANFKQYAEDGFYNGTIFHRVIDGFMIQGGGFGEDFVQKETREQIQNEADNGLSNLTGTVAMARTNDPHSATAQFFINVKDNLFLNHNGKNASGWGYCVFGKVTSGMDVVNKIKSVKTGSKGPYQDVPKEAVIIQKVTVA
jgi:peptidyl-prolyl cis-trans isomerase B (cyclophilin B)